MFGLNRSKLDRTPMSVVCFSMHIRYIADSLLFLTFAYDCFCVDDLKRSNIMEQLQHREPF